MHPNNWVALIKSDQKMKVELDCRKLTNEQPNNKDTLEKWAPKVGASSRTLNRLFNQNFGMGFSRWKQKLRILKSLELLDSKIPLVDIAFELVYESTSAFITSFKKQMGCSPKKYFVN